MKFIEWDDQLSVNVREIDLQHQKLVEMVNEFHDAVKEKKSKDAMAPLLSGLTSYALRHFATEEKYFKKYGFPGASIHIKEHQELAQKVADMKSRFESGKMLLTLEVAGFLRDWLTSHIQKSDMTYKDFFNSKGLR